MNNNLKIGLILGGIILIVFLIYAFSNKSSQNRNPESLQGIDEAIFFNK